MAVNFFPQPMSKYVFNASIGLVPDTIDFSPAPDVIYIHAQAGSLSREQNANCLLSSFKIGGDIFDYFIDHYNGDLLILIHGPSPRIVHQLIYAFIGISSLEDNPPTPFILGASHLPSLISYNQWREAHLGEQHALLYLDSYAAFKAYMGYPLMDVHPKSLENYFVNISELLES